jgi:hypothetical protein
MVENKTYLRLAVAIHERLVCREQSNGHCYLPEATWERCQTFARRVNRAQRRGWRLAAARCERDLRATIDRLQGELAGIAQGLANRNFNNGRYATIEDLYRDMVALHEEFVDVSWDWRAKTLSVTTDPIELRGVYLGPFEIRLAWCDLAAGHPNNYRVIALDAQPAASNGEVTHPHVLAEAVCEGDGRMSIRSALQQGRLFDFFLIVRSLLDTYNSASPYVSLTDWHGISCADCGTSTGEDGSYTCEKCQSTVCSNCHWSCSGCNGVYCAECVARCEGCEENFCDGCLKRCAGCDNCFCKNCLDEQERCGDCHEEESGESSEDEAAAAAGSDSIADAGAPLQPDGLGQALVPA